MWKKWLWAALIAAVIFFLVPYSLPLIFAVLTAVMLEGMVQWIMKRFSFKRLQSVIGVFISYVLLLGVIGYNLVSIIAHQAVSLSERTPTFVRDIYRTAILPLMASGNSIQKTSREKSLTRLKRRLKRISIHSIRSCSNSLPA